MSIKFEYDFGDGDYIQKLYYYEADERSVKKDILKFIQSGKMDYKDLLDFIDDENKLQDFIDSHYIGEDLKDLYYSEAKSDFNNL
jgi:hypothetical protein